MHIFISHSSKDAEMAKRICDFLENKGEKCFLAPRDIRSGREYAEEIIDGIERSEAMILLMSEHANRSPHVLREVERAVSKSIPILVCKLAEVELSKSMEYFLMTHQWTEAPAKEDYSKIWEFVCDMEAAKGDVTVQGHYMGADARKEENSLETRRKENRKLNRKSAVIFVAMAVLLIGAAAAAIMADKRGEISGRNPEGEVKETSSHSYEVGDTVIFGSYQGEAIEWRVLKLSEDGAEAVLVAKNILTMKAFDAAESGAYNQNGDEDYWARESLADTDLELQRKVRGNNDWSVSNIRTWLNSADEVVVYADQPPMASAMSEKRNGYHNEAGFLYGFTEEELAVIVPTENVTTGNALADGDVVTEDKVYLLSSEELAWFDGAGISKVTTPTQAAIDQDSSEWYDISVEETGMKEYIWWLRDPVEGTASKCYMVGNGYREENIQNANVGLEGYGIRPAVTVDLTADCLGGRDTNY